MTTVCAALISRCCQQIIEDKTFGLKNKKKSKKVQNYVNQVVNATKASFVDHKKKKEEDAKAAAKAEKKKHKEEMADLFKASIIQPKVPFGVDPKTIACAFFKAGQCKKKGDACKFSHDQEICFGKKKAVSNKIDLCVDVAAAKAAKKQEEDIAITDPVELQKAIEKKARQMACETHIVCKHFLKAIEDKKYGWFWECPDQLNLPGGCKYRHALPPGYVFKDKKKSGDDEDEDADKRTLEEKLDDMRKGVGPGAMVTEETFREWKRKRLEKKKAEQEAADAKLKKNYKKGAKTQMTGRQLFEFDQSLFVDDAEAGGADDYKLEFGDVEEMLAAKEKIARNEAARIAGKSVEEMEAAESTSPPAPVPKKFGEDGMPIEDQGAKKPAAAPPAEAAPAAAAAALPEGIEENLFLDEDLDDLPSDDDE